MAPHFRRAEVCPTTPRQSKTFSQVALVKPQGEIQTKANLVPWRGSTDQNQNQSQFRPLLKPAPPKPTKTNRIWLNRPKSKPKPISGACPTRSSFARRTVTGKIKISNEICQQLAPIIPLPVNFSMI